MGFGDECNCHKIEGVPSYESGEGWGSWQSIGVLALMAGTWQSRGEPRGSKIFSCYAVHGRCAEMIQT
jgi:hypothetical protein